MGWGCYCPGTGPWSQNQNLHFDFAPRILVLRARALYREIKDEIDEIMEIKEIQEIKKIKEIDEINEINENYKAPPQNDYLALDLSHETTPVPFDNNFRKHNLFDQISRHLKNNIMFPRRAPHCSPGGDRLSSPDCRPHWIAELMSLPI